MVEERSLHDEIIREDELEEWLESKAIHLRYAGLPYVELGNGRSLRRFYFASDVLQFLKDRKITDTKADG